MKKLLAILLLFPAALLLHAEIGLEGDVIERPLAGVGEPDDLAHPPVGVEEPDDLAEYPPLGMDEPNEFINNEIPADYVEPLPIPRKKEFRLKNRTVEFAFDVSAGFANDFVAAKDILFKDPVEINLDDIFKGIKADVDVAITPLSLSFNWKDKWGFSLPHISIQASGNVDIAKDVINFKMANREKFGPGGAVFVDLSIPVFFHIGKMKVKLRPAGYLPVAYTSPGLYYTYTTTTAPSGGQTVLLQMDFEQRFFVGLPDGYVEKLQKMIDGTMDSGDSFFDTGNSWQDMVQNAGNLLWEMTNYMGYDLGLGFEYPVNELLDVGVNIAHLPLYNARLDNYLQMSGQAYFDSSKIDINELIAGNADMSDVYDVDYGFSIGKGSAEKIWRPFKMVFYADFRPFEWRVLSFIPSAGFALNPLYVSPASFEGGIKARLDLGNIFVTTIGIGYEDRKWKNSIDFVLFNLRALELDLGITFQSQDFVKSFQGAGAAVKTAVKFGW